MRRKMVQFIVFGFFGLSLLTVVTTHGSLQEQANRSWGINAVYAEELTNSKSKQPAGPPLPPPGPPRWEPGPPLRRPLISVSEPSTLVLLGTGLAVGGGIYAIARFRRRNKKT